MLDHHHHLKSDSIGTPKTQVKCFNLNDDPTQQCWALSSEKYIQDAVHNLKVHLESQGQFLKMRAARVLPSGYRPELDVSPYCDDESGNFYQQQVGILWWIVELGCIDIGTEVSMMASYSMAPREGHLQAVLHMFMDLSTHQQSTLVLDPSYIKHGAEPSCDWRGFYPDAKEEYPANAPEPLGRSVKITAFVDSDHAGDLITR